MKPRDPDPFASPSERGAPDDPFARVAPAQPDPDRTRTVVRPLARLDPDRPQDVSAEHELEGATSFEDILEKAQRQGFVLGGLVGAALGAAGALALVWMVSQPVVSAHAAQARAGSEAAPLSPAPAPAPRVAKAAAQPAPAPRPRRDPRASPASAPAPAAHPGVRPRDAEARPAEERAPEDGPEVVLPAVILHPEEPTHVDPLPSPGPAPEERAPAP